MRVLVAIASSLLLHGQIDQVSAEALPKVFSNVAHGFHRRHVEVHDRLRRDALHMIESLERRQDPSATAAAPISPTTPPSEDASKADPKAWDAQTAQACINALGTLNGQASSPSGMAVCYNVPFLDNSTGIFEAELRLYNVSSPVSPWTGVAAQDISVTLSYPGATVQHTNSIFVKRDDFLSWPPIKARGYAGLVERQSSASQELRVLCYVGQINKDLMGPAMNVAQLQPLLTPSIALSTISSDNKPINTTLSSTEASFVNGVFADRTTKNTTSAPATATPFVLPGVTLGIFPIGLIITCVWTGLFIGTVGFGTVERIQFRAQFRRRMKREMAMGVRTI